MIGAFLEKIFLGILHMSMTASIVILTVVVVRLFLRRLPKIFSYLLWLVVLFRLLCPFSFEAEFSLLRVVPGTTQEKDAVSAMPMQGGFFEHIGEISDEGNFAEIPMTDSLAESRAEAAGKLPVGQEMQMQNVRTALGSFLWLAGVGGLLIYSLMTLFRLTDKLKSASRLQKNVYVTGAVETPFVVGILRPRIYLPAQLTEGEKSYILLHEQIHIKRGDHIVKIVSFLALCLHWFNPLVWLAFFLLGKDMEMSCDEAVIRKAGSGVKKAYSSSLLSLATGKRIVSGVPLAFGEGDTKSRIKNVLKYKKPATVAAIIALVVCVLVAVVLLANPGDEDGKDEGKAAGTDREQTADNDVPGEVLYGVVTDFADVDGSTRRLLVVPNMGEIEVPGEAEIVMKLERESKELEAGDLVEISFVPGEPVSVLETWPGRFATDAETITVYRQGCALTYEGDDIYQFSFPTTDVPGLYDYVGNTKLCIYRGKSDGTTDIAMEMENWMCVEELSGNFTISVNVSREYTSLLLQLMSSDVEIVVEKEELDVQALSGACMINVRSIDEESRTIDIYVSEGMNSYDGDAPLQFADNCTFKVNREFAKYDFKETIFEEFVKMIETGDTTFNQPCLCTFVNGEITEISLLSAWNIYGISAQMTPPGSTFYEYVMEEEGEERFAECYTLVRTESADVSEAPGEEIVEIYAGNLGDGESGFVLFKDARGKLLYVQDAHVSRAGWNNIYVGENEEGAFILNVYVEDRWDFGAYGYWVYRLDANGEVQMLEGSVFAFEFGPNSHLIYDDDMFKEWIAPMENHLADSHLLLSTQEGELNTEAMSELDKYNYETLNLKER